MRARRQVVVVGLGRFGTSLATSLTESGYDVLALDATERKVQEASAHITHAVHADATDESVLTELGVKGFDIAIVAIGSDIQSSVLATVLLKKLGIPYVVARANNMLHGEILRRIGADRVVFPEHEMGNRIAHELLLGNVSDYFPVMPRFGIISFEAPESLEGRTLSDLGVGPRGRENVGVLIIRRGNEVIITPNLGELVRRGDVLILSGTDERLEAFLQKMGKRNQR